MNLDGFIPLDKPHGMSSQKAVSRVKTITGSRKAGHTGTLDPLATGLLLVAVGRATRLCQYFLEGDKGYRATIKFGAATDTGDSEGQVMATAEDFFFDTGKINATLEKFQGWISQRPPAASAIKIAGQRAYTLFRQGEKLEMPPRQVRIHSITNPNPVCISPSSPLLEIVVYCSKGTYIRSLAADIGKALGCPAHLADLVRIQVSQIKLEEAASLADLENNYLPWILDMAVAVEGLPKLSVGVNQRRQFIRGQALSVETVPGEIAVFSSDRLLGIGQADGIIIKPTKVLVQESEW